MGTTDHNMNATTCLNCGAEFKGTYCFECGQSASVGKITFKETIEGFFSSVFALEGPLLTTIKGLIMHPGKLFREFMGGKRKQYYKPVAFFIVMTAIYLIIRALIQYDPLAYQSNTASTSRSPEIFQEAARFMVDNINNIMFTLVLTIGLMLKLFFMKRQNLAEYTTIGFYIAGMYILFSIPVMLFMKISGMSINQVQLLVLFSYMYYCFWSFFRINSILSHIKYLISSALSVFMYVILGYGISFLMVWLR